MRIIKQISIILVLIVCFSCKNNSSNIDDNQGGRPKYGGRPTNSQDTTSTPDTDESGPMYGDKEIEWADGNTYTYDYTEEIETKDSLGNVGKVFTIYKRNKPVNVNCETKECRWCRKEIYAENYSIEEFPDLSALRGNGNYGSMYSFFMSMFSSTSYIDIDNKRIRTEWRVNCDYGGPDDFCSMKCQSEYNNR
jgi:hypothetical protein